MKLSFKFLQTGGVPLTNDLMALLEESYGIFEVLAELAGNLTILAGCDPVAAGATTINPGIVAIEGKLYYFKGGLASSTVFIHTEEIQKVFQDQTTKTLIEKRTVRFGNSVAPNLYNWADFVRLKTLKDMQDFATQTALDALTERVVKLEEKTAPIINGGIVWAFNKPANEIPPGWKEATDLQGKMLFGLDPNNPMFSTLGDTGGNHRIWQTVDQMPRHKHAFTASWPWMNGSGGGFSGGGNQFGQPTTYTGEEGGYAPMNIMNPYRIVLWIEPNFP